MKKHKNTTSETVFATSGAAAAQQAAAAHLFSASQCREALPAAREMTEKYPDFGLGWAMLGSMFLQAGQTENALAPMQRAAALCPDNPDVHNVLGVALLNAGQPELAEASSRCAIHLKPDYPEAHYNLGMILYRLGRLTEAEASFRFAVQLKPDYLEAFIYLGLTLQDLQRLDEAALIYRHLLDLSPDCIEAHNNLGNTLLSMDRLGEAEASYRRALAINPGFVEGYSNLGTALMDMGRMIDAETALCRAIELAPDDARPLATALTYLPYRREDSRFGHLESLYARREWLPLNDRIKLDFAMGRAMEQIGEYDRAFGAYEEGNRLYHQAHPCNEAEEENHVEKSCRLFLPELLRACEALEQNMTALQDDARVPVFILGMPRSGSTLIEQMLASHPAIFGAGELTAFKATLLLRGQIKGENDMLTLRKLGREYLDRVWERAPDARYITDKLPNNYTHLGLVHLMLPNAKIIHSVRDPLDTCFSAYALQFSSGYEYSYDLGVLGRQYRRYQTLMRHWHDILPEGRILDVRYEDCVADPEREGRRMLDFIGLPWDTVCLKFHESERTVRTASVVQVRTPIYSSSIGRWKHFEKHLQPLIEALYPAGAPGHFATG
jgi:Flp pilus assembly protein TadD